MQHIEIERKIPAAPERVWEVIADHRGYERWAGVREVVLRNEGDPAPNGLGATRVLRTGGLAIEEEVVRFDPPVRLSYRMAAGLPVRDYLGDVRLEPSDGGTRLLWTVEFSPRIPLTGGLLRRVTERALTRMADSLAAFLEAEPAP
jgi:uncharacterized protein YndB with AHSA1/START domain